MADGPAPLDLGFRAYRLAPSNFRPWDGTIPEGDIRRQLELAAEHVRPGADDGALLAELLLKTGFELTTPVAIVEIAGQRVYDVGDGTLLICLDRQITLGLVEGMAARRPAEILCLDAGFPDDQTKVNAGQIIASHARDAAAPIVFKVV
ncbi:MAG: hypothetical protein WKF80_12355 [Thermomicrobiales bacterium]